MWVKQFEVLGWVLNCSGAGNIRSRRRLCYGVDKTCRPRLARGALGQDRSIVTSDRRSESGDEGRVVRFRPRGAAPWRWPLPTRQKRDWTDDDLAKYEQPETEEDYRHRMKMNMLGLAVTIVLMVVGAWLVVTLAEIQKNQDCYLSGRRNCTPMPYHETQRG